MPFLSGEGVALLAARREGHDAVLVRFGGHFEPLHALWSRACLPAFERALCAGDPSLRDVARAVKVAIVEEAEWRTVDPDGRAFANANTPDDLVRLGLAPPG
jgi:molybdopterin-guanine dinucleotide biosynthesis protein A